MKRFVLLGSRILSLFLVFFCCVVIPSAIGDALGYPVEFIYSFGEIQRRYGRNGITRLDTHQWWLEEDNGNGKAVVSDDTQMTLFTACGLLNAKAENDPFLPSICEAYIEWLFTQMGKKKKGYERNPSP